MHKFKLGPYKGLNVPSPPLFTDDQLNLGMTEAAKKLAVQWAKVHKPTDYGDAVIVDLRPECADLFVPELSKSNYQFTVGDPSIPNEFSQLIGRKAGDELVLEIPFPSEFSVARVGGKTVTFYVTLREVIHRHPVELTDEIARQIDPQISGLEELKHKLRQFVSANWLHSFSEARIKLILDEIAKNSEYELDPEELHQEVEKIIAFKQNNLFQARDPQALDALLSGNYPSLDEQCRLLAHNTILENLIVTEIARIENITVEASELQEEKRCFLEITGDEQRFKEVFSSELSFHQYVLKEKIFDFLWEWNPCG